MASSVQPWCPVDYAHRLKVARHKILQFQPVHIRLKRIYASHPITGSYFATRHRGSSSTNYDAVTQEGSYVAGEGSDAAQPAHSNGNVTSSTDTSSVSSQAPDDTQSTWGISVVPEEDWHGERPFTLKDVDWGLAGLLGVILLLSFGAYRVLNHFRVYHHQQQPPGPQISSVVERAGSSTGSSGPSGATSKSKSSKSRSKQDKASRSSSINSPIFPAAAAALAAEGTSVPGDASKSSAAPQQQHLSPADFSSSAAGSATAAAAAAAAGLSSTSGDSGTAIGDSVAPPPPSVPGAPQPSPLDAGFSNMPAPWAAADLGHMDLGVLPLLPQGPAQPPELPSIQVDPPAKAVSAAEVASLPSDPSLPSLRERAQVAMRASGAAMEASQRAAAYSAAASSAASRAADAAEQAAAAAAAVQTALEAAAEEAMAEAVKRMNRAVEMVADAESRAAAAAAMATAYQDISDSQGAAAQAAADLPERPAVQHSPHGHIANLRKVLHQQLFDTGAVLSDWLTSVWAAIVGAIAWLKSVISGVWFRTLGALFAESGTVRTTAGEGTATGGSGA